MKQKLGSTAPGLVSGHVSEWWGLIFGSHLENGHCGCLHCGSHWGRSPETYVVWGQTLSWVYQRLPLSCKVANTESLNEQMMKIPHVVLRTQWWTGRNRKCEHSPFFDPAGELCEDLSSSAVVLHLSVDQCRELAHLFNLLKICTVHCYTLTPCTLVHNMMTVTKSKFTQTQMVIKITGLSLQGHSKIIVDYQKIILMRLMQNHRCSFLKFTIWHFKHLQLDKIHLLRTDVWYGIKLQISC